MKKTLIILVAVFVFACALSSCTPKKEFLSYAEKMHLEMVCPSEVDRIVFDDLCDQLSFYDQHCVKYAIASGEVVNTRHFIKWNREDCTISSYTINDVIIRSVANDTNTAGIECDQIVHVYQDYGLSFKTDGDAIAFISRKTGRTINDIEGLFDIESNDFEVDLVHGENYTLHIRENILPLATGETYSFILNQTNIVVDEFESLYGCQYTSPMDGDESIEQLVGLYSLAFTDDYIKISSEVQLKVN